MSRDTVWLDKTVAKCVPMAKSCSQKDTCARHLVSADGRPVADFTISDPSVWYSFIGMNCARYMQASKHRAPPPSTQRPYEPPKGLI